MSERVSIESSIASLNINRITIDARKANQRARGKYYEDNQGAKTEETGPRGGHQCRKNRWLIMILECYSIRSAP
jgi:hypothetical protein